MLFSSNEALVTIFVTVGASIIRIEFWATKASPLSRRLAMQILHPKSFKDKTHRKLNMSLSQPILLRKGFNEIDQVTRRNLAYITYPMQCQEKGPTRANLTAWPRLKRCNAKKTSQTYRLFEGRFLEQNPVRAKFRKIEPSSRKKPNGKTKTQKDNTREQGPIRSHALRGTCFYTPARTILK